MRYPSTALVLAAAIIARVAAGPFAHQRHEQFHAKRDLALLDVEAELEKRELGARDAVTTVHTTTTVYHIWGEATDTPAAPAPTSTAGPPPPPPPAAPTSTQAPPPPQAPANNPSNGGPATSLSDTDSSKLTALGFQSSGKNANSGSQAGVWIGSDGPYTNKFTNNAGDSIILVVWGSAGSWVNANAPFITLSLPAGSSVTISFATGQSGAFSAIYSDTKLFDGQVQNTWGEYTFSPTGVVDVSREVYANGHSLSIVGPSCTSDMNTCVFVCSDPSVQSCETGYTLKNCQGSGAQNGYDAVEGGASGGCGWDGSSTASLTTYFS